MATCSSTSSRQDRINRDDVWALIDRTLTHHERAYDNLPADEQLTTQVRLTLTDGSTRTAKVVHPRGTGDRNLTNADIRDKYAKLTHRIIAADRQAAIEKAVLDIDTLDDVAAADRPAHTRRALPARLRSPGRMRYPGPPKVSSCTLVPHEDGSHMPATLDPATA